MEDEPQNSKQIINKEEEEDSDEEFYEKIEAPKFVDFKAPNPYRPDDRYWFCLRVGCDQKHEEEMDAEAIYKNFVLQVMAARSPNIHFKKALDRKTSSSTLKCPLSAPPKSTKSRVSRLAVISSLSRKLVDDKGNIRPVTKITTTPKAKSKQVAAKYLTTPRGKKCLPSPNSFKSVPNPKPTTVAVPKDNVVAKALVFSSPKKATSKKTSVELQTPVTKICEGMKRLELTSQRNRILGYSNKSSNKTRCNLKKAIGKKSSVELHTPVTKICEGIKRLQITSQTKGLAIDSSRKPPSACKGKSTVKDLLQPLNRRAQEAKPARSIKGNITKQFKSMSKAMVENDRSGAKIDVKLRDGNASDCSTFNETDEHKEHVTAVKALGNSDFGNSAQEDAIQPSEVTPPTDNKEAALSNASRAEMSSQSNSDKSPTKFLALDGDQDDGSERKTQGNITKLCYVKQGNSINLPAECKNLEGAQNESEKMDSDDKENALASDDNRDFYEKNQQSGREILGRQDDNKKKVAQTFSKNLKDRLSSAPISAPGVKYRKPKSTNPKPFRLRTDERGILKEAANLDRKLDILAPQTEAATVTKFKCGYLHKRPLNGIQRHDKVSEQNGDLPEHGEKGSENNLQKKASTTGGPQTSRGKRRPKLATLTPQRQIKSTNQERKRMITLLNYGKPRCGQKNESSSTKTESSLQRKLVTQEGSTGKMTPGTQLGVIRESSSELSRGKEAGKPSEKDTTPANKATMASASSGSRGRVTVPKGPNFHSMHVPKSCTSKVT